jgi:hypothetical protein
MNAPRKDSRCAAARGGGQAMIESVFVIILACLCFLGIFQYANLFASKAVLSHAATRAARTRAVGFNIWMVEKSARVAAIPASGKRLTPPPGELDPSITAALSRNRVGDIWDLALRSNTRSPSSQMEVGRIPDYMDSINTPTSENILNYELWDKLAVNLDESLNLDGTTPSTLRVTVRQYHPLLIALEPLREGELSDVQEGESIALEGFYRIESHYPLYLEDMNW